MSDNIAPEDMRRLVELANKLAWKKPDLKVLQPRHADQYSPLSSLLQEHIERSHIRGKLILPDLRAFGNESVGVFSDYGGESSGIYYTYSVLVCGWNLAGPLHQKMKGIRDRHTLGTKEIAFKDFHMGQLQRALPDYLNALDMLLPGFLFTLAVDKRLISLFGPQEKTTHDQLAELLRSEGLGDRKPQVAEKLVRIVHLTAFLCGLLAHDGHKVFWMTDHDAICANDQLHQQTLELFARVLPVYTRQGCSFPLVGGAAPFKDRSVEMLDLLSVPDIVAGSLDQYLTQRDTVAAEDIRVKQGCDLVLQWLGHDGIGLKKMNVLVRPGKGDLIEGATLEFVLENPPADAKMIPIVV
jgi:hypothetical protein